jgi:hypothetical protein
MHVSLMTMSDIPPEAQWLSAPATALAPSDLHYRIGWTGLGLKEAELLLNP